MENTSSQAVSLSTLADLSLMGDPVHQWSHDVLVNGKSIYENVRIEVKASTIHFHLVVFDTTKLLDEDTQEVTLRLHQKLGAHDEQKWTDIVYTLTGLKTVLTDLNGTLDSVMYVTQVFTYSGVKIHHSK